MVKLPELKVVKTSCDGKEYTNLYYFTELPAWVSSEGKHVEAMPDGKQPYWWSNKLPPPPIGGRVDVRVNGFGPGTVRAYLVEFGWLGLVVEVDKRPDWHVKQNSDKHPYPMVFGAEVEVL